MRAALETRTWTTLSQQRRRDAGQQTARVPATAEEAACSARRTGTRAVPSGPRQASGCAGARRPDASLSSGALRPRPRTRCSSSRTSSLHHPRRRHPRHRRQQRDTRLLQHRRDRSVLASGAADGRHQYALNCLLCRQKHQIPRTWTGTTRTWQQQQQWHQKEEQQEEQRICHRSTCR